MMSIGLSFVGAGVYSLRQERKPTRGNKKANRQLGMQAQNKEAGRQTNM